MLGGWDQWDKGQGVAIGQRLAEKLGVTIGDPITIMNPNGANTPFGKTRRSAPTRSAVIFNLGMVEFDSFYIYMPMQPAQTYFKLYEDVLKPGWRHQGPTPPTPRSMPPMSANTRRPPSRFSSTIPTMSASMRDQHAGQRDRPLILYDWQQRNETFFSALQVERVVMFVILSMIIVVAAFNIISSLIMLVKDKGSRHRRSCAPWAPRAARSCASSR